MFFIHMYCNDGPSGYVQCQYAPANITGATGKTVIGTTSHTAPLDNPICAKPSGRPNNGQPVLLSWPYRRTTTTDYL